MMLALMTEEETTSQGMQMVVEAEKGKKRGSFLEDPEETQLIDTLSLKLLTINFCCLSH